MDGGWWMGHGSPILSSKKTTFFEISRKLLNIFSWLFLVPTEEFLRHILEYSELEKSENFALKNRLMLFFLKVEKIIIFVNISKTAQYFFLIGSGPHIRVLKTYSGIFWIKKIGKFSTKKSPNVFFLKVEKNILLWNISETAQYFFLIVSGPHRRFLKTYSGIFQNGKLGKLFTQKSLNVFFF